MENNTANGDVGDDRDYRGVFYDRMLDGRVSEIEPFLIEDFCAQVAWMAKECPVYPYGNRGGRVCHFLTDEEHAGYQCPVLGDISAIIKSISQRGTDGQKKALEKMADNMAKYGLMSDPPIDSTLGICSDFLLSNAKEIYNALNLTEKSNSIGRIHKIQYKDGTIETIMERDDGTEEVLNRIAGNIKTAVGQG